MKEFWGMQLIEIGYNKIYLLNEEIKKIENKLIIVEGESKIVLMKEYQYLLKEKKKLQVEYGIKNECVNL